MSLNISCNFATSFNLNNNNNISTTNNNDNFGDWVMGGLQNQGIPSSGNPGNDLNALLSSLLQNGNNDGIFGDSIGLSSSSNPCNFNSFIQSPYGCSQQPPIGSPGQNQGQVDTAILGAFKAFGVQPTGNKQKDMQTFLNKLKQTGANGGFNQQQDQAISKLMDAMQVPKTGNKNADLQKLASKLQNLGNGNQNVGNQYPPPPPPPPLVSGSNGISNNCGQNGNPVETAILGAFKAFGVQPTGNKDQDMQTFLNKLKETGANGGFNQQQGEAISRLMDVLGIEKTGNKNADLQKLPEALANLKN